MVNEQNLKPIISQQKLVEESPLSPAARAKVINKSGSNYVSERGKEGYGPMPYVDSQALMIAGSDSIMSRIEREFPNVATLLRWNREATLSFLKEKHAFSAYLGQNAFRVPCSHEDNYSKTGPAA
ncbi:12152_t:CDS:2, partial [Ambispora gerdemannii]